MATQVVRTAYDDKVQGQSVMPTRGFGDFYYKQKKDVEGHLLPPVKQVHRQGFIYSVYVCIILEPRLILFPSRRCHYPRPRRW